MAIVFDLSDRGSFDSIDYWFNDTQMMAPANTFKILIGNKADLDSQRAVSDEECLEKARELNLDYFEASAKSNQGVEEAFSYLATKCYSALLLLPDYISRSKDTFMLYRMKEVTSRPVAKRCCK